MKPFAKRFYKSKAWHSCRESYIAQRVMVDGGMCEVCKDNLGYILHHKILLTEENIHEPEITLNHDNLQWVCKNCHDMFEGHGLNKKDKPICRFDKDGQPIPFRE